MRDGDDNRGYWFGYMLGTVKDCARRTHDPSCVDALRAFVETSRLAQPTDVEALDKALSDDDPLYQGNRDDAERSAGLETQDRRHGPACSENGILGMTNKEIESFSRRVPDTPGLRLAGVFECQPDESCGARDGAA